MRGARASSSLLKITASVRKGPIRCSGIEPMAPLSSRLLRTRGDSRTVFSGAPLPACATRSRARSPVFSSTSTWPG